MKLTKWIAGTTLVAVLGLMVPAAPALANGAASTRNILLGAGLATYLIILHNRKVHEKYAEDARRQAEAESQANDAWAAYRSEHNAYEQEAAVNAELQKEIAYQHSVIKQQDHQLARAGGSARTVALAPARHARNASHGAPQVAMASEGWGSL